MRSTRSLILERDGTPVLEVERARLIVEAGPDAGEEFLLPERPGVLGRDDAADFRLTDDAISRRHAVVRPDGTRWRIEDLGSKAGVFLDDVQIQEAFLEEGSRVRVGTTVLRFGYAELSFLAPPREAPEFHGMLGASPVMSTLFGVVERVAPLPLPVLIQGPTGTGKERVAAALHASSDRAGGPYVVVDCGLLSEEGLRSELFGHRKGAFTGAETDREGAFRKAHGGTLLLDEIGEIPASLQPTLLRVLQEGEVRPLGGDEARSVDVRVVAATHRDLPGRIGTGEFRADLYYRLAAVILDVPALRDRGDDLELLARHFLPEGKRLGPGSLEALRAHPWPGNVRELRNTLQAAAALAPGEILRPEDLRLRELPETPPPPPPPVEAAAAPEGEFFARARAARDEIVDALAATAGNRLEAARLLGIARSTLYARMKKFGLDP